MTDKILNRAAHRPVDHEKTDQILKAATELFFAYGYGGTSIEAVAAAAGVSKVTVYKRFKNKDILFQNSIESQCDTMRGRIAAFTESGTDITAQLVNFGTGMLEFLRRPEIIRMERHLAAEAENHQHLGLLFLNAGPRRMQEALMALIAAAHKRGEIRAPDARRAAEHFSGMIKGFAELEWRYGAKDFAPAEQDKERAEDAVRVFLKAYAP